jgi:hypothetical protein
MDVISHEAVSLVQQCNTQLCKECLLRVIYGRKGGQLVY